MATDKKQETPVAAQGFSLAQLDSSSWLPWRRTKPGVINKTTKCIHYASWQLAEERAFASLREKCDNYSSLKLPEENVRAPGREKDAEQESGSVSKIAEAVKEVLRNIEDRTSFGVLKPSDNYTLVDSECERFLFYTLEESPGLPRLLKVWFKLTILSDDTVAWGISEASGFHAGPFFGAYTLKADAKALDVAMAVSFSENSILKDNCVPESVPGSTAHGPSRRASSTMTPQQIGYLQEQGFPNGLARELGNTRATYPLRFWVVDNSGSMRTNDGHQLRGAPNKIRVVPCNRWTELQGAVEYHAELAGILEATTTFRMLNDPGPKVGPQEFTVASDAAHIPVQSEVNQAVKIIRKSEPSGVTPLSEHLQEIRLRIEAVAPSLKAGGQQAVIVLATDGLPSDKKGESKEAVKNEFLASLRSLQNLPVWVVIRLCTDDEEIVTFYNDLDAVLELPFEVIDDFFGEGKEIYSANKWLNYGLPLHRCREMGYHHRIFDLLDERLLNKDELREFLELLFGADTLRNAPDIHLDWKGFASIVKQVVYANGTIFNPYTKRLDYWVDMKQLEKCYDNTRGFRLFGRRK